jgi:Glycosyl hydrolase family 99
MRPLRVGRLAAKTLTRALAAACLLSGLLTATAGFPAARASATPATPATGGRPAAPTAGAAPPPVFAYYYIWFSHNSWARAKKDLPLIGTYSSSDPGVLRHQVEQAKSAGITGFIVSWKDTPLNDSRLRLLVQVCAQEHFKLAMIYEGLDFYRHPLPASEVAAGFRVFRDKFAGSPVFYRVNGKPLTIWSGTWAYSYAQVAMVTSAVRPWLLVLSTEKDVAGFKRISAVTDGDAYYWSSVNPATDSGYQAKLDQMSEAIHRAGKYWIAPFAPGFDARMLGGQRAVPRDNGQTLRTEYASAVRSSPNMLGLISWNEFSENSYVEPSKQYGYQSLDALRQLRGTIPPHATAPVARQAFSWWPNVLRLLAFALTLMAVVAVLTFLRRGASRRRRRPRVPDPWTHRKPGRRDPGDTVNHGTVDET